MRWSVASLAGCCILVACGGKSRSDGHAAPVDSVTPPKPAEACFGLGTELVGSQLEQRALSVLGVALPADVPDPSEPNPLVRGQQLVAAIEQALDGPSIPSASHDVLRGFVSRVLRESDPPTPLDLPDSVAAAMQGELDRFVEHWVAAQDATLHALLTSPTTFVNQELAAHYGLAAPPSGKWSEVELPADQRAGILTLGAFLTRRPSPPSRATRLAEMLTCYLVPPPPIGVSVWNQWPERAAKDIVLEKYGDDSPTCWGCHRPYIGFGIALARYDRLGRYSETVNGTPIDTSYRFLLPSRQIPAAQREAGAEPVEIAFSTPLDLGSQLSQSVGVKACLVTQLNEHLAAAGLSDDQLSCVLRELDAKDGSFTSLLAILAPHYLPNP